MKLKKMTALFGLTLVIASMSLAQITINSDPADGWVIWQSDQAAPYVISTGDWSAVAGEFYGHLGAAVFPFQLPDIGAVDDPFLTADLAVHLAPTYNVAASNADLYAVRIDIDPAITTNDWYSGSAVDTNATLIQAGFLTPASVKDWSLNNSTDDAGDSNLVSYLNAAYAGGANAGKFVFLRVNEAIDPFPPSANQLYELGTRNAGETWQWPVLTLTVEEGIDDDGDGLPNIWETTYGLDPYDDGSTFITNGAAGDCEPDGLTNIEEFNAGTSPIVADTDGDGLDDGPEVHTYGTDPLDTDSDGDYLNDGDEVNTYGTIPSLADTDADDVNDATEVYSPGGNPTNALVQPTNDRPDLVGLDSFDYANGNVYSPILGGELFDYDNNVSNDLYVGHTGASSLWYIPWGSPVISNGRLLTQGSGFYRPLNGEATGGEALSLFSSSALHPDVDAENLYAKVELTVEDGVTWGGLSLFYGLGEKVSCGMADQGFGLEFAITELGIGTAYSSIPVSNNVTYTIVVKLEGVTKTANMWINPDLGAGEQIPDVALVVSDANIGCDGIRLAGGEAGAIQWDDLVVGTTWASLSETGTDSDVDGLRDTWELSFTNSLTVLSSGADFDGDGLDDDEEMELRTDPINVDTDGDGLNDGPEVNTYSTDPLDTDSDSDYLSDGDEVNVYGISPSLVDSDSDDVNDGTEVHAGSEPDNAGSVPANERPEVVGVDEFNYTDGVISNAILSGELFDYDNNVSNDLYTGHTGSSSLWYISWGSPQISSTKLVTQESGLYRPLNGEATGGEALSLFASSASYPEVDSQILYAKVEMTVEPGATWGGLSMFAGWEEQIYFGRGEETGGSGLWQFAISEAGVGATFTTNAAASNQTYTVVVKIDGATQKASMWIDPDLGAGEPLPDGEREFSDPANLRCDAIRLASGGAMQWDNLVVGTTWAALSATEIGGGGTACTISSMQFNSGYTEVMLGLSGLEAGATYRIQNAATPSGAGFFDVAGSEFVAAGASETVTVPVDTEIDPVMFFRAVAP